MKKILLILLTIFILITCCVPVGASDEVFVPRKSEIGLYVDGRKIEPETQPLTINGRLLYPARTAFSKMGVFLFWFPDTGTFRLIKKRTLVEMKIGSTEAIIDGTPYTTEVPPVLSNGVVMVPVRFVSEVFGSEVHWDPDNWHVYVGEKPAVIPESSGNSRNDADSPRIDYSRYKVVVDAGHGGRDSGAKANGLVEKSLNLDIALRVEKILKDKGVGVYMTRRTDTYPDLYSRANMANSINAHLFLSIHNNAGHSSYSGTMSLYCPTSRKGFTGRDFAKLVQEELVKKLGSRNIGLSARPELVVLRKTRMPAVIAEIGFLTNHADAKKLAAASYRQDAAEALANAVLRALQRL